MSKKSFSNSSGIGLFQTALSFKISLEESKFATELFDHFKTWDNELMVWCGCENDYCTLCSQNPWEQNCDFKFTIWHITGFQRFDT